MSTERVYLAGPMTGLPWFNFHTFDSARDWLVRMGFEVVSPADLDREVGIDPTLSPDPWVVLEGFDLRAAAARDLAALVGCSGIVLLPGWWNSKGARAELEVARWLGLLVWVLEEDATAPGWVLKAWIGHALYAVEDTEGEKGARLEPGDPGGVRVGGVDVVD